MNRKARELQYFLFSQYFTDAVRITVAVLLPAIIFHQFNRLDAGLAISIGAFGASLTESPGPLQHKRNGILMFAVFSFFVAFITEAARGNPILMGTVILLFSFFFSMLTVYGNRAASIGTATLLMMVLNMSDDFGPDQRFLSSFLILGGSLWYLGFTLLFSRMLPYLPAQQALGECIHEVSRFLRLKAEFYSSATSLEEDYKLVVNQQMVVSEKQDAARELLLKSRLIVKESTSTSRALLLIFTDLVDLYEQMMKIHYDYASLRERFGKVGILESIKDSIVEMADELDLIGIAIQSNTQYSFETSLDKKLDQLGIRIDEIGGDGKEGSNLALKKILGNLRNLAQRVKDIGENYMGHASSIGKNPKKLHYSRFVTHQDYNPKILLDNLSLQSVSFKHASRMAIACIIGFALTKFMANGQHSYWVVLTIIFILKPGFSLTKQRNYQRLVGTLIGGVLGVLTLLLIPDLRIQFFLLVLFMIGSYSFLRTNYMLFACCITLVVIIVINLVGSGSLDIVYERVLDTLIGCAIGFAVNYLVFPSWESEKLQHFVKEMIKANISYLQKLVDSLSGEKIEAEEYRLARKSVYVSSANLSAAFQRMTTEPKNRQRNTREVHQLVVLNHILSSYIATIVSGLMHKDHLAYPEVYHRLAVQALKTLSNSLRKLEGSPAESTQGQLEAGLVEEQKRGWNEDELLLYEQLGYLLKICTDISKVTETFLNDLKAAEQSQKVLHESF